MGYTFSWDNFEESEENKVIFKNLKNCIDLRNEYQAISLQSTNDNNQPQEAYEDYEFSVDGYFILRKNNQAVSLAPNFQKYHNDTEFISCVINNRPIKTLCYKRLENLKHSFVMYKNLMADREKEEQQTSSKKDFYKVVKVDTHVHHSACMNSKHLLKFIKQKLINSPNDEVIMKQEKKYTLIEIFNELNITIDNLCIDTLDTLANTDIFHRFDKFNLKYNPHGHPILREIFLKYDNFIKGKYLAEITKEIFSLV